MQRDIGILMLLAAAQIWMTAVQGYLACGGATGYSARRAALSGFDMQ